jgi:uncharacterized lipoprotein
VAAPFARTWDTVIDALASRVIAIETLERASGLVVASSAAIPGRTRADSTAALLLADCGRDGKGLAVSVRGPYLPQRAKYNVVVRDRGEASTVQVTVVFSRTTGAQLTECTSTGAFERAFETAVKTRAETP